ncbi:methyltransferase domain-containing protein [Nocardioides sp. JQ2195]|uniref:class I SAM-dependent methyltransferase n=1 Tax=Nocardioides sp. JQ2195 TaxID=2592334 RepID=UPI00143EA12D|nr:class I SAM-dependent methyltransferase [Nocardioides sp. JQ2195]QIX27923.1 methyltransferase domain-containing protein [Nocardioides sp. JQ2195]
MDTDELGERLFGALLGTLDVLSIHVGGQLGLYRALAPGPMTVGELSSATGMHPRYAREWLEQQCVAGLLEVDDPTRPEDERRFTLPDGHAPVLTDPGGLAHFPPFADLAVAATSQMPALLDAYRSGGGVGWAEFGPLMRTAQAEGNRPIHLHLLGQSWLPSLPEVDRVLRAGGSVADIGCGEGWSSIGIALAYPDATVDGYDVDPSSVEAAREHVGRHDLAGRVHVRLVDVVADPPTSTYDVVTAFECLHDMPDPVAVLTAARTMLADDGTMLVMDERVPDEFTGPGDPVEQLMYGFSMFVCLPDGMSHPGSAATGTVMRRSTLERYATAAGFASVEVLPIDHETFRFYRLHQ